MKKYIVLANSVSLPKHGTTYRKGEFFLEHHADESVIAELLNQKAIEEVKEPVISETQGDEQPEDTTKTKKAK